MQQTMKALYHYAHSDKLWTIITQRNTLELKQCFMKNTAQC